MLYHPWRGIRALPDWRVIFRDLDSDLMGFTHRPSRTVVIHSGLDQAERRCTIAHELEHVVAGHHGCQPPAVERQVADRAARRLLPIGHIVRGAQWTRHLSEFADYVWVDVDTARHRLQTLTRTERAVVAAAIERIEMTA